MTVRVFAWRVGVRRAVLLTVAAALIPMPAVAGDTTPAQKPAPIQAAMKKMAAREASKLPIARTTARRATQDSASKQGAGFFRTPAGIVALAVMGVGAGYALYSVSHDRVHSPAKQ